MLVVSDLQTWLAELGIAEPIVDGSWIPDEPNKVVIVFLAGGTGPKWQRIAECQTVAIRCRGSQRQAGTSSPPDDAATLAAAVDDAILGVFAPTQVGTQRAIDIDRPGASPRFMGVDAGYRSLYQAQYLFTTART